MKNLIAIVAMIVTLLAVPFSASAAKLEEVDSPVLAKEAVKTEVSEQATPVSKLEPDVPVVIQPTAEPAPVVIRDAFVFNRRTAEKTKVEIKDKSDYLGLVLELSNGDLVATGDDQVNFNLIDEVNKYNLTSPTRKLKLVSQSFSSLTPNEKAENADFAKYFVYEVNEEITAAAGGGNGVVVKTSVIEEANNFISAITMIKNLTRSY